MSKNRMPVMRQFMFGITMFSRMTVHLENGKTAMSNVPNNSGRNNILTFIYYEGKIYKNNWIDYRVVAKDCVIDFSVPVSPVKQQSIGGMLPIFSIKTRIDLIST